MSCPTGDIFFAPLMMLGQELGIYKGRTLERIRQCGYDQTLKWLEVEWFHRRVVQEARKQEAADLRQERKQKGEKMGYFEGVESEEPSEGGVWVLPGVYDVEVVKCKSGLARKGFPFFAAEFLVVKSDNPSRPPGCKMSWVAKLVKDTPALGDVRSMVATAQGAALGEVTEEVCEYVVGDANPLAGKRVHVIATDILTKEKKNFTKLRFEPCTNKAEVSAAPF